MAKGSGKYSKQRDKKEARYFKKKGVPQYPSGVQFAEEQPEPGGYEIASNATKWSKTGGEIAGPAGQVVGAGVGLGLALYNRKKIKQANREIRAEKAAYDDFGGYATDPKLMSDANMMAKNGIGRYKIGGAPKKGIIEIEGKYGTGEIHTDKDYNVKTIGTTPHTEGGDKTVAQEGDVVFDTQGDKKAYNKIMSNIQRYKMGSRSAFQALEKERSKLPAEGSPKKKDGDGKTTFGIPEAVMQKEKPSLLTDLGLNDTGGRAPYEQGMEPSVPFASKVDAKETDIPPVTDVPNSLDYNPKSQRLVYNKPIQDSFDSLYPAQDPIHSFLVNPETQAELQRLRGLEATDPKGAYKGFQDYLTKGNIKNSTEFMNRLRMQGFDPGSEGYGAGDIRNAETKTLDAALRYQQQYQKDSDDMTKKLYRVENIEAPTPTKTPDGEVPKIDPSRLPEDNAEDAGTKEEKESMMDKIKEKGKGALDKLGRNVNTLGNMLEGLSGIEGYSKSALKLDRYKYQDMSAPKIKELDNAGAVRRENRRGLVGSKGQQVSQAAQDEVMINQGKNAIINDEIARKMQIQNMNVDLANTERQYSYQEDIRAKDIERAQRAKSRDFGRAASAELAQMHDVDSQKKYMMSRDDKLYARDKMLANIIGTRSYDLNVNRDVKTGEYNPEVDLKLKEEYKRGQKVTPEKKENGSSKVKFDKRRYKQAW